MLPSSFTGAVFDSRLVKPGMLYIALKGEHADGRDFIPQALEKGAVGVIEGLDNLAAAAREWRRQLKAKVIGVTGSAGKTTVKELTAAFLRTLRRADGTLVKVHATNGNFNNNIGLPITLLNCPQDADFLVVEMGTNHPGEIAQLAAIALPDVGLISSIGTAHIEFFKSQDGIAAEKGTLFAAAKDFVVLARENDRYAALVARAEEAHGKGFKVVSVSQRDVAAAALEKALAVRLPGRHNVSNALVAFGCAQEFGAKLEDCVAALRDFTLPGGRWRVVEKGGVTYIDDTYNANPTAMMAALETFAGVATSGRRIAVLGDMFELGEHSAELHAQVLQKARALKLDKIITAGAAMGGGTVEMAEAELINFVRAGDIVLLKASHGMNLGAILREK